MLKERLPEASKYQTFIDFCLYVNLMAVNLIWLKQKMVLSSNSNLSCYLCFTCLWSAPHSVAHWQSRYLDRVDALIWGSPLAFSFLRFFSLSSALVLQVSQTLYTSSHCKDFTFSFEELATHGALPAACLELKVIKTRNSPREVPFIQMPTKPACFCSLSMIFR